MESKSIEWEKAFSCLVLNHFVVGQEQLCVIVCGQLLNLFFKADCRDDYSGRCPGISISEESILLSKRGMVAS